MNVLGMLNLADLCLQKNIHLTTYATGCIFHYDKDFPENSGKGFKEDDTPNFTGSYYSYTKASAQSAASTSKCCTMESPQDALLCTMHSHAIMAGCTSAWHADFETGCQALLAVCALVSQRMGGMEALHLQDWLTCINRALLMLVAAAGHGGEPAEGVPQHPGAARAHAHSGRPAVRAQLHYEDHPLREGGLPCCAVLAAAPMLQRLTKVCTQVVNIPNSMTVLPELLPYSIEMVRRFDAAE